MSFLNVYTLMAFGCGYHIAYWMKNFREAWNQEGFYFFVLFSLGILSVIFATAIIHHGSSHMAWSLIVGFVFRFLWRDE